jgi:hypothetical protein
VTTAAQLEALALAGHGGLLALHSLGVVFHAIVERSWLGATLHGLAVGGELAALAVHVRRLRRCA